MGFLRLGEPTMERLQAVFRDLCTMEVEPDGLRFLEEAVGADRIRDQQEYCGVRVRLTADLDGARIALQVDVGFGDTVTPGVVEADFPTLLELPAPRLGTYPRETVVAEKFQAMVSLGIANTRMKDFYDVWMMATTFEFDGETLAAALVATFRRRSTTLPIDAPVALSPEFATDTAKRA